MTIQEVYEKYKHLDKLLSDEDWLGEEFINQILYDLWQAIKQHIEKEQVNNDPK